MIIFFTIVVVVYLGHTKGSPEPWPQDLCAGRDTLCCGRHLVGERTIISPTSNYFALTKSRVEIALGHLGHIILVKELALVALLTQSSQPMLGKHSIKLQPKRWMINLAHNSLVSPDMSVRARSSPLTASSHLKMRMKRKNIKELLHKTRRLLHRICPSLGRATAGPQVAGREPPRDGESQLGVHVLFYMLQPLCQM